MPETQTSLSLWGKLICILQTSTSVSHFNGDQTVPIHVVVSLKKHMKKKYEADNKEIMNTVKPQILRSLITGKIYLSFSSEMKPMEHRGMTEDNTIQAKFKGEHIREAEERERERERQLLPTCVSVSAPFQVVMKRVLVEGNKSQFRLDSHSPSHWLHCDHRGCRSPNYTQ